MTARRCDPQEKIELVVNSARKLFVEEGYYEVSIPDIVKASGVSTGTIYHYFPSKEDLARQIYEQTLADFHSMCAQRQIGRSSAYEKITAFAENVFDIVENDPEMMSYILFMKHSKCLRDYPPTCFTQPFWCLQEIISEGIERGEIRKGKPIALGITYTGVILRAAELRLMGVLKMPIYDIAEELVANAWDAIKA